MGAGKKPQWHRAPRPTPGERSDTSLTFLAKSSCDVCEVAGRRFEEVGGRVFRIWNDTQEQPQGRSGTPPPMR